MSARKHTWLVAAVVLVTAGGVMGAFATGASASEIADNETVVDESTANETVANETVGNDTALQSGENLTAEEIANESIRAMQDVESYRMTMNMTVGANDTSNATATGGNYTLQVDSVSVVNETANRSHTNQSVYDSAANETMTTESYVINDTEYVKMFGVWTTMNVSEGYWNTSTEVPTDEELFNNSELTRLNDTTITVSEANESAENDSAQNETEEESTEQDGTELNETAQNETAQNDTALTNESVYVIEIQPNVTAIEEEASQRNSFVNNNVTVKNVTYTNYVSQDTFRTRQLVINMTVENEETTGELTVRGRFDDYGTNTTIELPEAAKNATS